jgi:hypothetical protein
LCCDPVHLHFARDTLLLADASGLAITRQEADTLMAGLNDTFSDIGRFEAPAPDRWYVHLQERPAPHFHPWPTSMAGRYSSSCRKGARSAAGRVSPTNWKCGSTAIR